MEPISAIPLNQTSRYSKVNVGLTILWGIEKKQVINLKFHHH